MWFTYLSLILSLNLAQALTLDDFRYHNREQAQVRSDDYKSCAMNLHATPIATDEDIERIEAARRFAFDYFDRFVAADDPQLFATATLAEARQIAERLDDLQSQYSHSRERHLWIMEASNPVKLIRNYFGLVATDEELKQLYQEVSAWGENVQNSTTFDRPLYERVFYDASVLVQAAQLTRWRGGSFKAPPELAVLIGNLWRRANPDSR